MASGGQADNDIDCHDIVEGKTQEAYHPPTSSLSSVHLVALLGVPGDTVEGLLPLLYLPQQPGTLYVVGSIMVPKDTRS